MADITLLVAQVSASLTTLMGIVSLVLMYIVASKLVKDTYQGLIMKSFFFFLLALIGVTAMTTYHFKEGNNNLFGDIELWDSLWYGFMFLALAFSFYVSLNIASFGKKLKSINISIKKTRKSKKR